MVQLSIPDSLVQAAGLSRDLASLDRAALGRALDVPADAPAARRLALARLQDLFECTGASELPVLKSYDSGRHYTFNQRIAGDTALLVEVLDASAKGVHDAADIRPFTEAGWALEHLKGAASTAQLVEVHAKTHSRAVAEVVAHELTERLNRVVGGGAARATLEPIAEAIRAGHLDMGQLSRALHRIATRLELPSSHDLHRIGWPGRLPALSGLVPALIERYAQARAAFEAKGDRTNFGARAEMDAVTGALASIGDPRALAHLSARTSSLAVTRTHPDEFAACVLASAKLARQGDAAAMGALIDRAQQLSGSKDPEVTKTAYLSNSSYNPLTLMRALGIAARAPAHREQALRALDALSRVALWDVGPVPLDLCLSEAWRSAGAEQKAIDAAWRAAESGSRHSGTGPRYVLEALVALRTAQPSLPKSLDAAGRDRLAKLVKSAESMASSSAPDDLAALRQELAGHWSGDLGANARFLLRTAE